MAALSTIALGTALQPGSFGGGNQFAHALAAYLQRHGITVVYDLTRSDIDAIIITSVKPWARSAAFDVVAALRYATQHPAAALVLRVNECDERKGQHPPLLNTLLRTIMPRVDHTVFVSAWLQATLCTSPRARHHPASVISSGADPTIFNADHAATWDGQEPFHVVTHHWSSSWYKGWDVYQALDDFLGTPAGAAFRFTFIGNPWPGAQLHHTTVLPPHSGAALARLLKKHHGYISGSQHEPAGMHYIEAMQCGLPVLWRASGSLPEYCADYGIGFTGPADVIAALQQLSATYSQWKSAISTRTYTANDMCQQYLSLLQSLVAHPPTRRRRTSADLRLHQGLLWLRDSLS